jgi:hypothetical protein
MTYSELLQSSSSGTLIISLGCEILGKLKTEDFRISCVGIQKHFMVAEIPGFDLSNRLSDLTTSLSSSDGIGKLIFKKVK